MSPLLQQIKRRRLMLGLKQADMMLRMGMSRQQYQRLEAKGNPRLDTLELIARGLNSELLLIPKERLREVVTLLEQTPSHEVSEVSLQGRARNAEEKNSLSDDPWQGLLGDDS